MHSSSNESGSKKMNIEFNSTVNVKMEKKKNFMLLMKD